jgi:predicted membrane-bound spermidine synthase
VARAAQRRAQGVLFAFLTLFFAGIATMAYLAGTGVESWVFVIAAGVLALWMGGLAIRSFRAAREEMAR